MGYGNYIPLFIIGVAHGEQWVAHEEQWVAHQEQWVAQKNKGIGPIIEKTYFSIFLSLCLHRNCDRTTLFFSNSDQRDAGK